MTEPVTIGVNLTWAPPRRGRRVGGVHRPAPGGRGPAPARGDDPPALRPAGPGRGPSRAPPAPPLRRGPDRPRGPGRSGGRRGDLAGQAEPFGRRRPPCRGDGPGRLERAGRGDRVRPATPGAPGELRPGQAAVAGRRPAAGGRRRPIGRVPQPPHGGPAPGPARGPGGRAAGRALWPPARRPEWRRRPGARRSIRPASVATCSTRRSPTPTSATSTSSTCCIDSVPSSATSARSSPAGRAPSCGACWPRPDAWGWRAGSTCSVGSRAASSTPCTDRRRPWSTPRPTRASGCRRSKRWPSVARPWSATPGPCRRSSARPGLVCPVGDVDALVAAVSGILGNPTCADELRRRGRARAADFDVEKAAARLVDVYREMAVASRR